MKPKRIISFIAVMSLLALVGASLGCPAAGGGAAGMSKLIPEDASWFDFTDIKALRADDDLEDLYEDWEDGVESYQEGYIDCDDVTAVAYGAGATIYDGKFDLDDIRDELEDQDYDDDDYKDVEVWKNYEWVALMRNRVIIGSEDAVKDCIKVIKGRDSLWDNRDAKDVLGKLPGGVYTSVSIVDGGYEAYEGLEASGWSYKKKDEDTMKVTMVYKFEDDDAAEDAVDQIEDDLEAWGEEYEDIDVDQDGEFVIATCEVDIEDIIY